MGKTNVYILLVADQTGIEVPVGPEADIRSDRKPVSDEEGRSEKKDEEVKKKSARARILSPHEEPVGFSEWLGFHFETKARSVAVPRAGTTTRSNLARAFARLVEEGYELDDFKAVSVYAARDGYWKDKDVGYAWALRLAEFGERAAKGRALMAAPADPYAVDYSQFDDAA